MSQVTKKYLIVFSYQSHSYRYSDDTHIEHQGIRNKVIRTNGDVFSEQKIKDIENEIQSDFNIDFREYCDECHIVNIIPLNN